MKEFKIVPIRNGTVIDHLQPHTSIAILDALDYPAKGSQKVVSLSINLPSDQLGIKDVLKFEDIELSPEEIKTIQQISKTGSLSVIRNYDIADKERWGL